MSRKSRRARRPNVPMHTGPVAPARVNPAAGGAESSPAPVTRSTAGRETIDADYTHVIADLKRIGLLAGGLIAILVALSFFIR